jgi:hypothetical protein
MKYSFDDIRPMKVNGGKVHSREPIQEPSKISPPTPKLKPKQIEDSPAPKTRVRISDTEVPWLAEPPHKVKGAEPPRRSQSPETHVPSRKKNLFFLWFFGIVIFVAGILFLGNEFRQATITLTPKIASGAVDASITATQSGTFPETIPFETMTLSETVEKTILATEAVTVNQKAKGIVILYNKAGAAAQELVSGTRLSAPDGKIYTLERSVSIPGQKKVNGTMVPGQVEATIIASESGEAYNGDPTDFSIVAYKGTSKYTTVYARSKGPRTGGAVGTGFKLSKDELEKAKADLSAELREKLFSNAEKQVPHGYVFSRSASVITTPEVIAPEYSARAAIMLQASGTITAVLIPEQAFAYSVAKALTEDVTPQTKLEQPDSRSLSVQLSSTSASELTKASTITLTFSGTASVRWKINTDVVREHLLGIDKMSLSEVVAQEPGVGSATLSLMPWYVKRLPEKDSRITIAVQ